MEKTISYPFTLTSNRQIKMSTRSDIIKQKINIAFSYGYGELNTDKESGSVLKGKIDSKSSLSSDLVSFYFLKDIENNVPEASIIKYNVKYNNSSKKWEIAFKYFDNLYGLEGEYNLYL